MSGYLDLLGELGAQFRDVGDDADHAAGNLKALDGLGDRRERIRVERAEALVDEQAVEVHGARRILHLPAELQGQGQ